MANRAGFSPLNDNPRGGLPDSRRELLGPAPNQRGINNPSYTAAHANPQSELEQVNLQINRTTDQSLDSTRRMVRMMEESQEAGAKTMENLYRQGEQLDRVEDNMDQMNQDMREAERNMQQMEKCCGLCVCPWRRRKNFEKSTNYKRGFEENRSRGDVEAVRTDQPSGVENARFQGQERQQYIQRITNDAREDEMDDNLHAVGGMLTGLKAMGQDMGREIGRQNQQLDRLNTKAIVTDDRVNAANTRANDILRKA
ncbi:synaptosomal-associated protein 23-like [Paramacrobiotus metropolitanus]|uniref:synaptosomal-associated protein 23-like n=1 Tax=Paramacrobiotus metropolitanus TaxID=2943436 RepID=UPI0024464B76|nr:synaptosomal-associated protein 23-like [Paramacrobiotus metropolitanus]XP_055357786.1 synaptosomal-associated protein 23-like [Paramacrobiotus metropolitanus]XP_055357787.1 synaptosomal-associated protein 23-like [Paramacrobiotus metropolitanus]